MTKMSSFKWKVVVVVIVFALFTSGAAFGAGFAVIEHSVRGLGNAFSGGAASAEDATTVFFNPAGLTRLTEPECILGAHIIIPSAKFTNEGSTHVLGGPLTGNNGGNCGVNVFVPNVYYSRRLKDNLAFGIGVNSPFDIATDYNNTWVGRYHAIKSVVMTININPSLAYKVNEYLSIGGGFSAQYLDGELSNAIDFGTLDSLPVALGGFGGAFGFDPSAE